ncbi:unnamed protein product, partial [Heterobilharzia americana]
MVFIFIKQIYYYLSLWFLVEYRASEARLHSTLFLQSFEPGSTTAHKLSFLPHTISSMSASVGTPSSSFPIWVPIKCLAWGVMSPVNFLSVCPIHLHFLPVHICRTIGSCFV